MNPDVVVSVRMYPMQLMKGPGQTALVKVLAGQSLSFQTVVTHGTYSLFVIAESLD